MKQELTIKEIIAQLRKLPEDATVTLSTTQQVEVVGFVFQRKDGQKQIAEVRIPRETANV
jgi:carbonic anhydrase